MDVALGSEKKTTCGGKRAALKGATPATPLSIKKNSKERLRRKKGRIIVWDNVMTTGPSNSRRVIRLSKYTVQRGPGVIS